MENKKIALVIMAAGIGSRFGTGIKQLAKVDGNGHIIMDYSVHDALAAGFTKIVFIIRRDIEAEFRAIIGDRMERICAAKGAEVVYAFQSLTEIPGALPEGRTKPWGTGQAVLAAKDVIDCPFAIINADDYYGKKAYKLVADYLKESSGSCMAGFRMEETLSDNGSVTRGVCLSENGYLTAIEETHNIEKVDGLPVADGKALDPKGIVSMNMWGLQPEFMTGLEEGFKTFFEEKVPANPMKAEYLIPEYIGGLMAQGAMQIRVLETDDTWYGMTYQEDVAAVQAEFRRMLAEGVYAEDLYGDI